MNNRSFATVEDRDSYYDELRHYIDIPEQYRRFADQYEKLLALPQPAQRSPEWYKMRNDMVTASSTADCIGESKHKNILTALLDKLGYGEKFKENRFVYHGKKYEKIATMIYEHIYDAKVGEFGLIPHPEHTFVGASPDGICMTTTMDGKFSDRVGRMLEIKCPPSRVIQTKGKIDDGICPHYYWVQVQQQLECCDLDECDFWQCHIVEFPDEQAWREDVARRVTVHTEEQDQRYEVDQALTAGVLVELLPKDRSHVPAGDEVCWYGKYIYPSTLLKTLDQHVEWARSFDLATYPGGQELAKDYEVSRTVYYRCIKSHNVLIKRDRAWWEATLPKVRQFWERVEFYRAHPEFVRPDLMDARPGNKAFLACPEGRVSGPEDAPKKKPSRVSSLSLVSDDESDF